MGRVAEVGGPVGWVLLAHVTEREGVVVLGNVGGHRPVGVFNQVGVVGPIVDAGAKVELPQLVGFQHLDQVGNVVVVKVKFAVCGVK